MLCQSFLDLVLEFFLAGNHVLAKYLVEQLLVHLCVFMTGDLLDLKAKVACSLSHFLFIDLQERSDLSLSTLVSLIRVEYHYGIYFSTDKFSFFFLILDIHRHQDSILNNDTTFFRGTILKLGYRTFYHIFFLNLVYLVVRTEV